MKVNQTINDALINLGVIDATENPTPEDSAFALRSLNRILDLYNTQNLTIPYTNHITYENDTWTSTEIEIGSGKTIDATAPANIQQLLFLDNSVNYECRIMTQTEYEQIRNKSVVGIPTKYFTHQTAAGVVTVYLNMIPISGMKMRVYAKQPYSTEVKITDDIDWGTGVEKMLMLRLSTELAASYHINPAQLLFEAAAEAENYVKTHNYSPKTLKLSKTFSRRSTYNPARF